MKTLKKILACTMALSLAASLTACKVSNSSNAPAAGASSAPAAPTTSGTAAPSGSYTIRIACENSESFPATLGLAAMKKYVESHTNGAVKIDIYASGQLGGEEETLEQVSQGTLEMAVASFAPVVSYDPAFEVMDIPFVYNSYEQAWMVMDSYVGTDPDGHSGTVWLEGYGIYGEWFPSGYQQQRRHPVDG